MNSDKLNILPNIKLFDSCVKPILLYCSELLCLETLLKDNANVESKHFLFQPVLVQVKFAKYILGVNKTASNLAVLGKLGMIPCSVDAIKLAEGFWHHVVNSKGTSLIRKIYDTIINCSGWYSSKIKWLFDKIRFGHVWENQNTFSKNRLTFSVNKKLKEDYIKFWKDKLSLDGSEEKGNKLRTHSKLKEKYEIENFLKLDIVRSDFSNFIRISRNSTLMIEKSRHRKINLANRICPLCRSEVEDEFHFNMIRDKFFQKLTDIVPLFSIFSDLEKFFFIFRSNDYDINMCCIKGISEMYQYRNSLM